MFRKLLWVGLCLALTAFGQADRGTITGTVTDPANAVVPNATIVARNADNGLVSQTTTTSTGSYTIPSVPAGNYDVSVEVAGFKKFTQNGITVRVAQTARVDVILQVGSTSESVTVTSDAPLLNTENAEQTHNISGERLNALPINFGVSDGGYVRSPFAFINLMPGASNQAQNTVRVNGMPNNSHTMRFEGQESTNTNSARGVNEIQPSVEAIQDIALQTSNFAAEYGQVGGGLFNFTAKSGTNGLHGSAYIYFVNEVFNAGVPFTNAVKGGLVRPRARKNDWGGSFGGPVVIPKVYNGRNKTFFFLNWERYKENKQSTGTKSTVPSDLMRSGDFSQLLTGKGPIGTDRATGASILENAIYDPASTQTINGIVTRTPFAGNAVPFASQDPVALKIQSLVPHATLPGVINNFDQVYPQNKIIVIPSMKIDHMLNDKHKMSFYLSRFRIDQYVGGEGLPVPITSTRILYERSWTARLNYDWAVQPTFLMHFGLGFIHYSNPDVAMVDVLKYDAVGQLGLNGGIANNFVGTGTTGFPRINAISNSYGGLAMAMGPSNANKYKIDKPTAVLSGTYIKGNHTYKAGADWRIDTFEDKNVRGSSGNYTFAADESADPSTNGQGLSGVTGAPYASFLMGRVNSAFVSTPQYPRFSKKSLSLFVQDTWKVSRKLTFDYGVRWDYQGGARETHGRVGMFAPDVKNPSAGNIPGAMIYDNGKVNFTTIYPYAIGPRLGAAYQLNSKTVFRAGWGVSYSRTTDFGYITNSPILGIGGWNTLYYVAPSFGDPAATLKSGLQYTNQDLTGHEQDIGILPYPGRVSASPPYYIDRNGGRPPRINQWTISLQREFTKDLVLEASYVGNRAVWVYTNNMVDLNGNTAEGLKAKGFDVTNAADYSVLTSLMSSSLAQARNVPLPYASFPLSATVAQALRPFPQFGFIPMRWSPTGNSWYDALQTKATKRLSKGLDAMASFTWQKELTTNESANINNVYNRAVQKMISPSSQPLVFVVSFNYQIPVFGSNKMVKGVLGGWTVSGIEKYSSGFPILAPYSTNGLNSVMLRQTGANVTFANRVPGQPLFLHSLNDPHSFDPSKDFVLNPAAWTQPAKGTFGTAAAYYNDYRYFRQPNEQLSLGRTFRIREGVTFHLRAEFFNVFNRTVLVNPDSTNAAAPQLRNAGGFTTSGFGRINTGASANTQVVGSIPTSRNGQIVGRFQF